MCKGKPNCKGMLASGQEGAWGAMAQRESLVERAGTETPSFQELQRSFLFCFEAFVLRIYIVLPSCLPKAKLILRTSGTSLNPTQPWSSLGQKTVATQANFYQHLLTLS